MALRLNALKTTELSPRIVVFGVGGAGGNAVNNMIDDNLQGVDFVVANTDSQALARSKAERRIQIGLNTTQGLGAGANPQIGMAAAEESQSEIMEQLGDAHMVFITAGMGGGTGTGAAPTIAKIAREMGILTVAVVTKPFHFEGPRRMAMAEAGLAELQKSVDTLIVIPNQNLFRVANDKTTFQQAFMMADKVLHSGVRGVTDLMIMPGLINLDFADVKSVMSNMGKAMMGTGEATGERRAIDAAISAINNPLLEDVSLKGAKAVLINITGGYDMTLFEFDEAANQVKSEVDPNANIIVGSTFDESLEGTIRVSVVASGIDGNAAELNIPDLAGSQNRVSAAPHNTIGGIQTVRINPQPIPHPQAAPQPVYQQAAPQPIPHPQPVQQAQPAPIQEPVMRTQHVEPENHYDTGAIDRLRHEAQRDQVRSNYEQPAPRYHEPAPQERPVQNVQATRHGGASFLDIFSKPKRGKSLEESLQDDEYETDQYADDLEKDLSVPAFLRRQAN